MNALLRSYTVAASLFLVWPHTAAAQDTEVLRIEPPVIPGVPTSNNTFGRAVALSDELLFVGDDVANGTLDGGGEVYIYKQSPPGWTLVDSISGAEMGVRRFGRTLAVDQDRFVIGSQDWDRGPNNDRTGRVDIFELQPSGHWGHAAEVFPWGVPCPWTFGRHVALSGDTLAVASLDSCAPPGVRWGQVHMFRRQQGSWVLEQTLRFNPPPSLVLDVGNIGSSLALQGDTLVAGAPTLFGSALVYRRSGGRWGRVAILTDPATTFGDRFGISVAIDGSTIVVGASSGTNPYGVHQSGAAVVFEELSPNQWTKVQRLRPSDPFVGIDFGDKFGGSVAIDGDEIVVSSRHAQTGGFNTGAVYYFRKDSSGWPQTETVVHTSRNPVQGDWLGVSVALQDGIAVGGLLDLGTTGSGAALVFGVRRGVEYCTTLPNSTGSPTLLRVVGSDEAANETIILNATNVPPGALGGFVVSAYQTTLPLFGGFFCLGTPFTRLGPMVQADLAGDTIQRLEMDRVPHLWGVGSTLNFQFWYEDNAAQTIGFSNPIELTLR